MKKNRDDLPACFGILDEVFPKSANGLRESPERCQACHSKVDCLREAVSGSAGAKVREEVIDRAYHAGAISFLERWSKKKYFQGKRVKQVEKKQKE